MMEQQELELIAKAFAQEALLRALGETNKLAVTQTDHFYSLFSDDRALFHQVRAAIMEELIKIQAQLAKDVDLAFEKVSVEYSQHRS